MKTTAGSLYAATANKVLTSFSPSPIHLLVRDELEMEKKGKFTNVPTIDISSLYLDDWITSEETKDTIQKIGEACQNCGFFQIINHNISSEIVDSFDRTKESFFNLEKNEKRLVKRNATNSRGWFDDELTKQTRDW